jgi:hypothetical protein
MGERDTVNGLEIIRKSVVREMQQNKIVLLHANRTALVLIQLEVSKRVRTQGLAPGHQLFRAVDAEIMPFEVIALLCVEYAKKLLSRPIKVSRKCN